METQTRPQPQQSISSSSPKLLVRPRSCASTSKLGRDYTTIRRILPVAALLALCLHQSAAFSSSGPLPTSFLTSRRTRSTSETATPPLQRLPSFLEAVKTRPARRMMRSTATAVVQRVKPKTQSSEERRLLAIKAMDRQQVESALTNVDARMLELLSDQFLYPTVGQTAEPTSATATSRKQRMSTTVRKQQQPTASMLHARPKGRPEFVPGAMNYDTMQKFQQQREVLEHLAQQHSSLSEAELSAVAPYISSSGSSSRSSTKTSPVKGESASTDASSSLPISSTSTTPKKRKRVVKNLPPSRRNVSSLNGKQGEEPPRVYKDTGVSQGTYADNSNNKKGQNSMDLAKYYRTQLLTADEEYSLGIEVQFMAQCEEVHEGLAIKLERLPSMQEWASACGFTEPDATFVATEADELLRPAGSEAMFLQMDPSTFIGNGLAGTAGPGRGRGRQKTSPPLALGDFYDDSHIRAAVRAKNMTAEEGDKASAALQPMNRGTPTDFVELLMTSREAKQRMVQSNMRLVVSIARKYSNVGVSLQDLVQEGSLGLSRAAEKFEPQKGFKFSTYASWWIQQAVFRSIAYHSRTIRLPVHVHNLLNRIHKVRNALLRDLGRKPTNEEMAQQLGMTLQKYNKMIRLTRRSISLETPKYQSNPKDLGHESEDLLGETISASSQLLEHESTPEKRVDRGLFLQDLRDMLEILDEDERRVILLRYGLSDGLTRTVTAVAVHLKQSKAWVRSQECRALRKLRRPWYEKKLKEHEEALTA